MGIVVPACIVAPLAAAIWHYKILSPAYRALTAYLSIAALSSIIISSMGLLKMNNMPAMQIYTLVEFLALSVFYKRLLDGSVIAKYIPHIIVVYCILFVLNIIFYQPLLTYNSYTRVLEAVIVILYSIIYFTKNLDDIASTTTTPVGRTAYVNAGFLLYFSGSLALFLVTNLIELFHPVFRIIWSVHATLLLILYILLTIALWKYKK